MSNYDDSGSWGQRPWKLNTFPGFLRSRKRNKNEAVYCPGARSQKNFISAENIMHIDA